MMTGTAAPRLGGPLAHLTVRGSSTSVLAAVTAAVLAVVYLYWTPLAPDLAAQVARADLVRHSGAGSWSTGWFGGLSLPSYSVLVPSWMAVLGVRATGVVAVLMGAAGSARLVRSAPRPRAAAVAFAVTGMADLLNGRVTFTAGLAVAVWALVALELRWRLGSLTLAVIAYLASPLAGLFLAIAVCAVIIVDRSRRRQSLAIAGLLLLVAGAMAVLFPGTGRMPFTFADAIPAALCAIGVIVLCPQRTVRTCTALLLLSFPVFVLVPTAVGDNITRLVWVGAVPVAVAYARLPRPLLAAAIAVLAIWPAADLLGQLTSAHDSSSQPAFYRPLLAELGTEQRASGPTALGRRVEVVDTVNHWASAYLSSVSLARGWDRQADVADDPIFYDRGELSAANYHDWLHQLAVGWVALPAAALDYASVEEGKLVSGGLPYLTPVWSTPQWRLYRVDDPTSLATGATVVGETDRSITLSTTSATPVFLRLRWSPYLRLLDADTLLPEPACVTDIKGWVQLTAPRAGTFQLTSRFTPTSRLRSTPGCTPPTPASQVSEVTGDGRQ